MMSSSNGGELTEDDILLAAETEDLNDIYQLKVSRKRLSSLGDSLLRCHRLRSLDISFNRLSSLAGISELSDLRHLNVAGNALTDVREIASLPQLSTLYINGNKLNTLHGLGSLSRLEAVWAQNNHITNIEHGDLPVALKSLDISGNPLSSLKGISSLNNLHELSLAEIGLDILPTFRWATLVHLSELNLNSNRLTEVLSLRSLPKLAILHIDDNQLEDIGAIPKLPLLTELYAADNQITSIVGLHLKCPQLDVLDVEDNAIPISEFELTVQSVGEFCHLEALHLKGNPMSRHPSYRVAIMDASASLCYLDGHSTSSSSSAAAVTSNNNSEQQQQQQQQHRGLTADVHFASSEEMRTLIAAIREKNADGAKKKGKQAVGGGERVSRPVARPLSGMIRSGSVDIGDGGNVIVTPAQLKAAVQECRDKLEMHRIRVQEVLQTTRDIFNGVDTVQQATRPSSSSSSSSTSSTRPSSGGVKRRLKQAMSYARRADDNTARPMSALSLRSSSIASYTSVDGDGCGNKLGKSRSSLKLYADDNNDGHSGASNGAPLRKARSGDISLYGSHHRLNELLKSVTSPSSSTSKQQQQHVRPVVGASSNNATSDNIRRFNLNRRQHQRRR